MMRKEGGSGGRIFLAIVMMEERKMGLRLRDLVLFEGMDGCGWGECRR